MMEYECPDCKSFTCEHQIAIKKKAKEDLAKSGAEYKQEGE